MGCWGYTENIKSYLQYVARDALVQLKVLEMLLSRGLTDVIVGVMGAVLRAG